MFDVWIAMTMWREAGRQSHNAVWMCRKCLFGRKKSEGEVTAFSTRRDSKEVCRAASVKDIDIG